MRKEIIVLGLAGLLGCDNRDVSTVDENVNLTKPEDCDTVKDIRYLDQGTYQVLCSDKDGNLSLYNRYRSQEQWEKIKVK